MTEKPKKQRVRLPRTQGTGERPAAAKKKEKGAAVRRPHNAKGSNYKSLVELVEQIGAEPRKIMKDGREVTMSRMERTLRLAIEGALQGKTRQLSMLVKLMARNPELTSERHSTTLFINGSLARL